MRHIATPLAIAILMSLLIPVAAIHVDKYTACNNWTAGADLPTPRFSVTVNKLPAHGGNIYMIGGWGDTARTPDTIIYDIESNSYSSGADHPSTGVAGTAQVLYNGRIYVFGGVSQDTGFYTNQTRIYDIASDTWTSGTNAPWAAEGMFAILDPVSNLIYTGGGCGMPVTVHDEWYAYNPNTDIWTEKAPTPMVCGNGIGVYYEGDIYIVTGTSVITIDEDDPPWKYDIATDTWTTGFDQIPTKVVLATGGLLQGSGRVYLFGGKTSHSHGYTDKVQVYDIGADAWSTTESDPTPICYGYQQGTFVGSTYYTFGGWDGETKYATLHKCTISVNMIRVIVIATSSVILAGMVTMIVLTLHKTRRIKVNGKR